MLCIVYKVSRQMNRNNHGFTIVEIVVVLVLISIIAAAVFTRSITTDQINYSGQVEKIQNHISYAKALAMKASIDNEFWGIDCDGNYYWLFHLKDSYDIAYYEDWLIPIKLPGEENEKISFSKIGVSMNAFTLYFDKYGHPFSPDAYTSLSDDLVIDVLSAGGDVVQRAVVIKPETGLITTQ